MKTTKTFVFAIAVLALTLAASAETKAKKQDIKLYYDTTIAGTQLKAGDYKVAVDGDVAEFYKGGQVVAKANVTMQDAGEKYRSSSLVYAADSKSLLELRLEGKTSKLVVGGATSAGAPAGGRN